MKLSVIIVGRNDDYVGECGVTYLERVNSCIRSLNVSLENTEHEILLFDFRPPPDKPMLSECITQKDNVRFIVFSDDDYKKFVSSCYSNGFEVIDNYGQTVPEQVVGEFNFNLFLCINEGIKSARGEYILNTVIDDIFPIGLEDLVKSLEYNIMYRCWRKNISGNNFSKQFENILYRRGYISDLPKKDEKKRKMWAAAGDFQLMDRNSWLQIRGYPPFPMMRSKDIDNVVNFTALSYNKKICAISAHTYNIVNVHLGSPNKTKYEGYNCKISYNGFVYNHREELRLKQFKKYNIWGRSHRYPKFKEIYHSSNYGYRKRNKAIKSYFKGISPDIGTI